MEDHEGGAQPLFLLLGEVTLVDAVQRLALHELPQQFDQGEDKPDQVPFDGVRVGADAAGGARRPGLADVVRYGGQQTEGPGDRAAARRRD